MTDNPAHFTAIDGGFMPTAYAQSHWGEDHLNGPAVVGLAAREMESQCGSAEFMPTRLTVDLFKAARTLLTTVEVRLIRDGRRVRTVECDVVQGGTTVARGLMVSYRRSEPPPGEQWSAPADFVMPAGLDADPPGWVAPYTGSDVAGWTANVGDHQNASRTRFLDRTLDVVGGHANSPFVRAAVIAEATSLTTNLGTHGVGYINGDLTVALARLPQPGWLGVQADSHWASDGIAVGSATLFDHAGPFGTGLITAVANAGAQIDFSDSTYKSLRG